METGEFKNEGTLVLIFNVNFIDVWKCFMFHHLGMKLVSSVTQQPPYAQVCTVQFHLLTEA